MTAVALGVGLGGVSNALAQGTQKIPLRLPFAIDRDGATVGTSFEIREDAIYAVNLVFPFDPAPGDRERVWHLVGGSEKTPGSGEWREPGAPVTIELLLHRQDGGKSIEVLQTTVAQPRLSSWGEGTLTARLAAARLTPGLYRLDVRSLQAAPALRDVRVLVGVTRAYMGK